MDALENPRFRLHNEDLNGLSLEEAFKREAVELGEQQAAEIMLYQYIIASASRHDTPLDIPLGLAAYLSKVNDLPSGRILEAALPPLFGEKMKEGPLERVLKLSEALSELAPAVKKPSAADIKDDGKPWISLPSREFTAAERKNRRDELWRHNDIVPASRSEFLGKNPKEKESRPIFYRVALLIMLAICFFLAMKNFGCSSKKWIMKYSTTEQAPHRVRKDVKQQTSIFTSKSLLGTDNGTRKP